jgi:hypothetical protein
VTVAASLLMGSSASLPASALARGLSHGLYLPAGLQPSIQKVRKNGIQDLVYEVSEPYPAPRFISALEEVLSSRGWTVPQQDPLNLDAGPHFVERNWARWSESDRPSPIDGAYIRDWQCEWLSPDAALVRYVLRYRRASPSDAWSPLKVVAVYWPPEVLRAEKVRQKAITPR